MVTNEGAKEFQRRARRRRLMQEAAEDLLAALRDCILVLPQGLILTNALTAIAKAEGRMDRES